MHIALASGTAKCARRAAVNSVLKCSHACRADAVRSVVFDGAHIQISIVIAFVIAFEGRGGGEDDEYARTKSNSNPSILI